MMGPKGMSEVEDAMRKMATERDAEVRKIAKGMWEVYMELYEERVGRSVMGVTRDFPDKVCLDADLVWDGAGGSFTNPLTPTTRRYLNIKPSAGGPPPKMHPLSQSTNVAGPRLPSAAASGSGQGSRSVSSSSTSAQLGGGTGQRAVSGSGIRTTSAQSAGFPFPTLPSEPAGGRSALSRSTSAAVIQQHYQQAQQYPAPGVQHRAASSADIRAGAGARQLKMSTSTTQSSLQSMIDPIAHTRQAQGPSAGPSRPRVISNVSSTDTPLTGPNSSASTTTTTTAQARRANLAAIGQGPVRPARSYTALGNVTEGKESTSGASTPRGGLFGAPMRPNLQARVTSAGFALTSAGSGSTTMALGAKRVVSAGVPPARKPILPPGVQARVDAKQAQEAKREDEERDVFSAPMPAPTDFKSEQEPREKKTATARQGFRPTTSEVKRQPSEARETLVKTARATVSAQTQAAMRTAKSSPQAKLVVSPRQPRIKMKPPIPSSTIIKKKPAPVSTKAAAPGASATAGRVRANAVALGENKERTPFRPQTKGMVRSTSKVKMAVPEARSSAVSSPTPKARIIVGAMDAQHFAARVPLPPSPSSNAGQEAQQVVGPVKVPSQTITRTTPDSPMLVVPAASQNPALLAEEIPLPDSDEEDLLHTTSPTITPTKLSQHASLRLADLLVGAKAPAEELGSPLLNESCPIAASSPAPSSSAETIPIEWESDVQTEDEGAEGDNEIEAETSIASVTFKKPEDRNAAQRDTLARAVARRLVAQKAEMEKEGDLLKFSSESEPEKEMDLLELSEASEAEDDTVKEGKKVPSRILADKGTNSAVRPVELPATPDKALSSQKRPRVRQLQQFFENLSPPDQHEAQSPGQSSPLGNTSGRVKVRMMGHGATTPSSSPPPRLAA